jgi:DNA-binding CsgD family transcriptional regulator
LLKALEVAFAPYGVRLDQHRPQLESALEALRDPQIADPSQFTCCLQHLLREAEDHWQQRAMLSAREWELLRLLAEGLSYRQIGRRLYLSPSTVKTHMRNLQQKLGVAGREEILRLALARGWISDVACLQRSGE